MGPVPRTGAPHRLASCPPAPFASPTLARVCVVRSRSRRVDLLGDYHVTVKVQYGELEEIPDLLGLGLRHLFHIAFVILVFDAVIVIDDLDTIEIRT